MSYIFFWLKRWNGDTESLAESTLTRLGVKHKLIRPYTPRHNGKVERSHCEDHNKFILVTASALALTQTRS